MNIEVLAPTRGRPERAATLIESFAATRHSRSLLWLILDRADPRLTEYMSLTHPFASMTVWDTGTMVARTNAAAKRSRADILGFAADDNVFVTEGWDRAVLEAFEDPKVTTVNTNDLLVGDSKGGSFFIRNDKVHELGWFLPPFLEHLYVDYAITELAKKAGTYVYLPSVVIEHAHPYAGKAKWDAQYREYNNSAQDARDRAAFEKWWREQSDADAEVLRR